MESLSVFTLLVHYWTVFENSFFKSKIMVRLRSPHIIWGLGHKFSYLVVWWPNVSIPTTIGRWVKLDSTFKFSWEKPWEMSIILQPKFSPLSPNQYCLICSKCHANNLENNLFWLVHNKSSLSSGSISI